MENKIYKSISFWVKSALLCFILAYAGLHQANGQDVLWGTSVGGDLIYSINSDGGDYQVHKTFSTSPSESPEGYNAELFFQGEDGYYYGRTMQGGDYGFGSLFQISPDGSDFQVLLHLTEPGELFLGEDNRIYGAGSRSFYRMNLDGTGFEILHTFSEEEGVPQLFFQGSDNYWYGSLTVRASSGSIFKINSEGNDFETLYTISSNGLIPVEYLIQGRDGTIYGLADVGNDFLSIFSINPDGSGFEFIREFGNRNHTQAPNPFLLEGSDGYIYGVLAFLPGDASTGDIFRMSPDGSELTVIHEVEQVVDYQLPFLQLEGPDGFLYGYLWIYDEDRDESLSTSLFRLSKDGSDFSRLYTSNARQTNVGPFILQVEITCPLPTVPSPTLSESSIAIGTELTAHVPLPEDHSWIAAIWHWGDGETSEATFTDTTAVGSHVYASAGSYSVRLEVTDDCGTATSPQAEVEVTDEIQPGTGSVKGSGMFSSPRGAYTDKPQMKGMAHYSINAKAEDGGVSGTFQFHIADLQFRSSKLDRLIVEDNKAWLYGEGKIKGKGRYGFLIAAVDNQGSKEKDLLRVKIWDLRNGDRLVYDNQPGHPDDAVARQEIDKGTIIILGDESGSESDQNLILDRLKKIKAFPNPVQDRVTIDLGDISPDQIHTLFTDAYGHMELRDRHRKLDGNLIEFDLTHFRQGTYYIRVETREGHHTIKILKK